MEKMDIVDRLKQDKNELWLYGAGSLSKTIADYLLQLGINIAGAVVDDEYYVPGKTVGNLEVHPISSLSIKTQNVSIIAAHGEYIHIKEVCELIGVAKVYYFASVVYGRICKNYAPDYINKIENIIKYLKEELVDDTSHNCLEQYLQAIIYGDASAIMDNYVCNDYFENDVFKLDSKETYLDIGAYTGDTILDFLNKVENSYTHIYGFEADEEAYDELQKNVRDFKRISLNNICLWKDKGIVSFGNSVNATSEENIVSVLEQGKNQRMADKLDNILSVRKKITLLKINFTGSIDVLKGAYEIIRTDTPKIACTVGWDLNEFMEVVKLLKSIDSQYKLFLRYRLPLCDGLTLYAVK